MKQMTGKTKDERYAIPEDLMIREFPSHDQGVQNCCNILAGLFRLQQKKL